MQPNKNEIRVGIVGCGAIAGIHLRALNQIPGARCTALYDIDRGRAESLRASHGLKAEVLGDLSQMAVVADAVILALPNAFHAEYAVRLLKSGLHVLCEKPLATTLADAEHMAKVARQEERTLMCGLIRRFYASTELAAEAIRREIVGRPVHCDIRESSWGWPFSRAFFDPQISGGGVLIDTGPHTLDLLSHLLGPLELISYEDDAEGGVEANAFMKLECSACFRPSDGRPPPHARRRRKKQMADHLHAGRYRDRFAYTRRHNGLVRGRAESLFDERAAAFNRPFR